MYWRIRTEIIIQYNLSYFEQELLIGAAAVPDLRPYDIIEYNVQGVIFSLFLLEIS